MLNVAIETGYATDFKGRDLYGARSFMQDFFVKNNIKLVRVSMSKFNEKKQCFTEYTFIDPSGKSITIKKNYVPDIIRSRKSMASYHKHEALGGFMVVPSRKISIICNDKFETYTFTKSYQPFTSILGVFFKNKTVQKTFKKQIVLKPIRASGGKGILLTTVPELLKRKKKYHGMEELYIVQQFKDFSSGYPGIAAGNHDVRLMFAGKDIIEVTLRIPKAGDFRSNIGSGGTQKALTKKQLPKDLLLLSKKIYASLKLDGYDILSMDFAYCKKDRQRYLLEINASPGTWYYQTDKKILQSICRGLVRFFITLSSS